MLENYIIDWLNLSIRFLHLITGIAWIGASFYFNWLENNLERHGEDDKMLAGHLWAVHGGGFYYLQKYKKYPETLPSPLHWFKWEAYITWVSGISLMAIIYYYHADAYLVASDAGISPELGILLSVYGIIISYWLYDRLCRSTIVDKPMLLMILLFAWFGLLALGYSHVFTPRATFIQTGVMLGTIMVANVFFVIMPVQRELVKACELKQPVSRQLGYKGLTRSRHNNYFTLPVLFIMISGHYPMIQGAQYNWLVLIVVTLIAILIRHIFNIRGKQGTQRLVGRYLALIFVLLIAVIVAIYPRAPKLAEGSVSMSEVRTIVNKHCISCHAAKTTSPLFANAPLGFKLDTNEQIINQRQKIFQQSVASQVMPLNNLTKMTPEEREKLGLWIHQYDTSGN